jgi:tetratricopeptide (TPR) repeat protein
MPVYSEDLMLCRLGLILLSLLLCAASWAQVEDETFNGPHIDKLIGEGRYEEAFEFLKAGIQKREIQQSYSATFYAGLGKFYMEEGRPKDALEALKAAETVAARTGLGNAFTAREMAAYQLSQGDFGAAAASAAKATREFSYRKADKILLSFCRSLEAMARLRSGDIKRAEALIREALKDVPKSADAPPLFASRTLFAACVIESHRANYEEAREFCRRGVEIVESRKIDGRDISLAHLAMAESWSLSGDPARSREFAVKAMDHTAKTFQANHPDTISALILLARADMQESKWPDALAHATSATAMAVEIFGEGAGGTKGPKQVLQEATKAGIK